MSEVAVRLTEIRDGSYALTSSVGAQVNEIGKYGIYYRHLRGSTSDNLLVRGDTTCVMGFTLMRERR
ncbi:hypothetical protein EVAR_5668_1 [Eumeta japonica]|uniref:Uncharacterized protein n=1 Tax=Eumeta variegata TaxID=151549 RepID=A0A4C1T837_EUMVA|nr:hypothetical protein EVAR_5668_1 [Eumeta japonica]